jgi:hypothetical protein
VGSPVPAAAGEASVRERAGDGVLENGSEATDPAGRDTAGTDRSARGAVRSPLDAVGRVRDEAAGCVVAEPKDGVRTTSTVRSLRAAMP